MPVLERLGGDVPLSIDTAKAEVARRALELGAELVNDVTALRGDPAMAEVVAASDAYVCLMHMLGEPRTMQDDPRYDDVVSDVKAFLEERLAFAVAAGIAEERICVDPGIGFGKTVEDNVELLRRLDELVALGRPVLVGASRKRFLGRLLGDPEATVGPLGASVAAASAAVAAGATIVRVHDVRETVESIAIVKIELHGVEVFGYHGATDVEEREGQMFLFDVSLWPRQEPDADDIERTIDYREVATCVREVSDRERVRLLETLAGSLADELMSRFAVERVRVRVRKPQVQLDPPAEFSAVTVDRP